MQDGEVLLIDYAPEVDHDTSDITRTWPVNGKFSARQAELYGAVLEAQAAGIAAVKPGATIDDVERACTKVFEHRGSPSSSATDRATPSAWRSTTTPIPPSFVPGVCFTVEPGLYEASTGIGIRIEDVVCVTENGCEVFSRDVPKDRASMERLVGEQGVLDWLGTRDR